MMALTDQYLAALVKHDPSELPLSKGVRFTENIAEIRIGRRSVGGGVGSSHHLQDLCRRS